MTQIAASGNMPAAGTYLNPIQRIRDYKIRRIRRISVLSRISVFRGFGGCGSVIQVPYEYSSSQDGLAYYEEDGPIKPINFEIPKSIEFTIGDRFAWAIKVNKCTYEKIQQNDPSVLAEALDYHNEKTMLTFDQMAFAKILGEAHPSNRGNKAGYRLGTYIAGTKQNPLVVSASHIWMQTQLPVFLLRAQQLGRPSIPYALYSGDLMTYAAQSPMMSSAWWNGACKTCDDGSAWIESRTVQGIEWINHDCIPRKINQDTGSIITPVLFGYKEALWSSWDVAMASKQGGPGDDGFYFESIWSFGLKLIEPRWVGVLWFEIPKLDMGAVA